jgi:hypothetical protein
MYRGIIKQNGMGGETRVIVYLFRWCTHMYKLLYRGNNSNIFEPINNNNIKQHAKLRARACQAQSFLQLCYWCLLNCYRPHNHFRRPLVQPASASAFTGVTKPFRIARLATVNITEWDGLAGARGAVVDCTFLVIGGWHRLETTHANQPFPEDLREENSCWLGSVETLDLTSGTWSASGCSRRIEASVVGVMACAL